jgi:hypothetical protein
MSGVIIDKDGYFQVDPKLLIQEKCHFCQADIPPFDMMGALGDKRFCFDFETNKDCYTLWSNSQNHATSNTTEATLLKAEAKEETS